MFSAFFLLLFLQTPALAERIINPYYKTRAWKVWRLDPSAVVLPDGRKIAPPPEKNRLYPTDNASLKETDRFVVFRHTGGPKSRYAGTWDDVYLNLDNGHSYIQKIWSDKKGNEVRIRNAIIHLKGGDPHAIGANFTSRSTTGMGHDLANTAKSMAGLEKYFYFANILFSGPAHISYLEYSPLKSADLYEALSPVFYNSVGSSGSETSALSKMIVAGAYLSPDLKLKLKEQGLYASTMLYIWKAALPYEVPFENELRHRVAYFSLGDGSHYRGPTAPDCALPAHEYDDSQHVRNMIEIARNLETPPPEALITVISDSGCIPVYYLKKTVLVRQKPYQTAKLRVSTAESYDIEGRPLRFTWKVLYGNKNARIEGLGDPYTYEISVPYDPRLPKGRTSILLVADNGVTNGNPAVINFYRTQGKENLRPRFTGPEDATILPGEEVFYRLKGKDPEGFPLTYYKRQGVGAIKGDTYRWKCPPDHPGGEETVTIIASDGTAGNSYAGKPAAIFVRPTVAVISADTDSGRAPLSVAFSSRDSRDGKGGPLKVLWDFDDGSVSQEENPRHEFEAPGFYQVKLRVEGPLGFHTAGKVIQAKNSWPVVLHNGWGPLAINKNWLSKGSKKSMDFKQGGTLYIKNDKDETFSLESLRKIAPPFCVEAEFERLDWGGKAWGLDFGGIIVGNPGGKDDDWRKIFIFTRNENSEIENALAIARKPRYPWRPFRLRFYAREDFETTGHMVSGYMDTGYGEEFFQFKTGRMVKSNVAIYSNDQRKFLISRLRIRGPSE